MPQRLRLLLAYEGTDFAGWQRQAGLPTVQGALEAALHALTGEAADDLEMQCAGRTDAGVHAIGQVVTLLTRDMREPRRFAPALNHFLPPAIRVQRADAPPAGFDVRQSSLGKTYRYALYAGPHPLALGRTQAWHVRRQLDVAAMQRAADDLVGRHDYESFRHAHCDASHARRHLTRIHVALGEATAVGQHLAITLEGNAFCRHMCRIIVGTLVEVGYGRRAADSMEALLAARDRRAAGETAPPGGLVLVAVHYPAA